MKRLIATVVMATIALHPIPLLLGAEHDKDASTFPVVVRVTAYSPVEMKCPKSGCIMASGKRAQAGHIAISRDLEKLGLRFGDKVSISGLGYYEIQDRMHRRKLKSVDVFTNSYKHAKQFGVQYRELRYEERTNT